MRQHWTTSSTRSRLLLTLALALPVGLVGACEDKTEGSGSAGDDGTSGGGEPCTPGRTVDCPCPDGTDSTQTCNDEGTFDACECDGADGDDGTGSGSGGSGSATAGDTSDGSASDTSGSGADTSDSASDTNGDSDSNSTGGGECTPGAVLGCDCDGAGKPGVQSCSSGGELGPCECCPGTHPIVEDDKRFCDAGNCYCGDLNMDPPLDACYDDEIAEACCTVSVVCY